MSRTRRDFGSPTTAAALPMAPYRAGLDSIAAVLCYSIQNDRKIRRSETLFLTACPLVINFRYDGGDTGECRRLLGFTTSPTRSRSAAL